MTVLAVLFIVAAVADWGAAAVLTRAAWQRPRIRFLSAVAVASVIGALGASVLVPLAINVLTPSELLDRTSRAVLLVAALLLFAVPGPAFVVAYLLGYFHEGAS